METKKIQSPVEIIESVYTLKELEKQETIDRNIAIINYLKTASCEQLTPEELKQFAILCKMWNLNPLKRQIYAIKYSGKFQIVIDYYEYVKRADKTGLVEYYNVDIEEKDDKPYKATFRGKRKDWTEELVMTFYFSEWNKSQSTWKEKPFFMFEKVALANGLRRLFPNELGDMPYIVEEDYVTKEIKETKRVKALKEKTIEISEVMEKDDDLQDN